jgi:protein CpxP
MFNPFAGIEMKTWMKRTLIGMFGASALIGGLAACSHRAHAPWSSATMSEADQAKWRERMVDRVASKLELDAAQKTKLSALADTLAAQRKQMMGAAGTDPRAEFQAVLAGERFDRSRAQALVDAKTSALREASPAVIAAAADFYDSLKPAQQEQVRSLLARGRHRHGWRG